MIDTSVYLNIILPHILHRHIVPSRVVNFQLFQPLTAFLVDESGLVLLNPQLSRKKVRFLFLCEVLLMII
jgi:hypothetical protein